MENKKNDKVPIYLYDIYDCTMVQFIEFKNNKVNTISQDSHPNHFKLTISPKSIKWREFEEHINELDLKESTFNEIDGKFIPLNKNSWISELLFTAYKYKDQGIYTIISKLEDSTISTHNYDCVKSTKFKDKDKKNWFDSDFK